MSLANLAKADRKRMEMASATLLTNGTGITLDAHCEKAWKWWRETLKSPTRVLAPMVEQSELTYRMLSREYGCDLCYSPMIHARLYAERQEEKRYQLFSTVPEDRPLVVQFCGNDPQVLLKAALAVQDKCDAVDLNLGCPQGIAKKGNYGAYLLEDQDTVLEIVRTLSAGLKIPLTVKVRLLPDREASIDYCQRIIQAGASVLTVHGRNREEKGQNIAGVDWAMVKRIKEAIGVPLISNGGIAVPEDFDTCMATTGADAVMSSEMSLAHPAVFRPVGQPRPSVDSVVARLFQLMEKYSPVMNTAFVHKPLRAHLFKLLYPALQSRPLIRDRLACTADIEEMRLCTVELAETKWEETLQATDPDGWFKASWYCRHRGLIEQGSSLKSDPLSLLQLQLKGVTAELAAAKKERDGSAGAAVPVTKKIKNSMKRRIMHAEKLKLRYERKIDLINNGIAPEKEESEENAAKKLKTEATAE